MLRKIYVVTDGKYNESPIMAFSDENEAIDFAERIHSQIHAGEYLYTIQLAEGSVIDELLCGLERKLNKEGIEITGVEFEGDNA